MIITQRKTINDQQLQFRRLIKLPTYYVSYCNNDRKQQLNRAEVYAYSIVIKGTL
jgi:hypothetical protein